jgi:hypothetical protein
MRNAQVYRAGNEAFEKRLRAYAVGAGAVAAGLLAFSPPATAEIVVVPAHVSLGQGGSQFPINIEGATEFTLLNKFGTTSPLQYCRYDSLVVNAASGADVAGYGLRHQVAPLKFGGVIGTADQFETGKQILARAVNCKGLPGASHPFANTNDRFLGLKFTLNGQVYYGWAGFSVVTADGERVTVTATLTAYAYETEPNTPIYAGQSSDSPRESRLLPANDSAPTTAKLQPATLGVLALGSLGLDVWRKGEATETAASEA